MLNKEKHQLIMGRILRDIYSDTSIAPLLGLKGGTCAYLFYNLPRFSVDLDFDLFLTDDSAKKLVFEKIKAILEQYGQIKDSQIKYYTIFFFLSYGEADHNIKIEISTRNLMPTPKENYELREYLGISMFAGKKDYLFSSKLMVFASRSETAMRDIYDIWYFGKNNWDINVEIIKDKTGKNIRDYLSDCIAVIEKVKDNEILQGLGELVNEKEKAWLKVNLRKEAVFLLKNYQSALSR